MHAWVPGSDKRRSVKPKNSSYLLAFPGHLCAEAVTKMVDVFSQFSLDMQDGLAEDEPDSALLFEEDEVRSLTMIL